METLKKMRRHGIYTSPKVSRRELEVLGYLSTGNTHKEIAEKIHIAKSTVSTHINNIGRKLKMNKETALSSWYVKHKYGIIDL